MKIRAQKLTDSQILDAACAFTSGKAAHPSLMSMYQAEHSPIRTQIFWIEMEGIPTFVSIHLVRHNVGVTHFVQSNRKNEEVVTRHTPINHAMLINAQALINMARKRLCFKASTETRETMEAIRLAVKDVDRDLAPFLVAECIYRGGFCPEICPCGACKRNEA